MNRSWRTRLEEMKAAHAALVDELATPGVLDDRQRYADLARRASELAEGVAAYDAWTASQREASEAEELLGDATDPEERTFYDQALREARARMHVLEERIGEILTPRDPRDERPVIVEIRAGAGGDEAALFAGELLRMYQRFAERRGFKADVLDASESPGGGIKEVVFELKGKGAFTALRFESGVHRVQRVPVTESSGRIHTSTATVAVLPEADAVEVEVSDKDLKIETYRASGPGGQHVNTTDSAVRITHLPTRLVVTCQSERSQRQNMDRAMRILLAKLKERAEQEAHAQLASERKAQVGTGERAEKIRTYNFPQNRVTDHRVPLTVHGIPQIMDGDLDDIVTALARWSVGEPAPVA